MSFTPGPWISEGGSIYTDDDEALPIVWDMGGIDNPANARLIASAPDLLRECKSFLEWYVVEWGFDGLEKDFPAIRETLVKAGEGQWLLELADKLAEES